MAAVSLLLQIKHLSTHLEILAKLTHNTLSQFLPWLQVAMSAISSLWVCATMTWSCFYTFLTQKAPGYKRRQLVRNVASAAVGPTSRILDLVEATTVCHPRIIRIIPYYYELFWLCSAWKPTATSTSAPNQYGGKFFSSRHSGKVAEDTGLLK